MFRPLAFAIALVLGGSSAALAEVELSVYTGYQTAPHSGVRGNDPGGVGNFDFNAKWDGRSFEMPPYYGFRATWWQSDRLGYGVEFNHAKVYSDDATRTNNGFSRLELTDGLNLVTANVMYRWSEQGRAWTPYVGAGVGVAVPHVDVETAGGKTFEYQVTGPAVIALAGVSYKLTDTWSLFGEYKGSYSRNKAKLNNGGTLETNLVTNALNIGVSYSF